MKQYLTIKETSEKYKISKSSLYRLVQNDPTFPAFNIGLRKKVVVDNRRLSNWIKNKNYREELIRLPSNTIIFRRRIHET